MSIRVFTFSKVVVQIGDVIVDNGAYTREPSNIIVGRLPRAELVRHIVEQMQSLTLNWWDRAQ